MGVWNQWQTTTFKLSGWVVQNQNFGDGLNVTILWCHDPARGRILRTEAPHNQIIL